MPENQLASAVIPFVQLPYGLVHLARMGYQTIAITTPKHDPAAKFAITDLVDGEEGYYLEAETLEALNDECLNHFEFLAYLSPENEPSPILTVQALVDGVWGDQPLCISQNLTDRWGEINNSPLGKSMRVLSALENDTDLHQTLNTQLFGEDSFVVNVDDAFGILIEFEYCTQESEPDIYAEQLKGETQDRLLPEAKVIDGLKSRIAALSTQFPKVNFFIPSPDEICEGRVGAWAFYANGTLNQEEIMSLGETFYKTVYAV